MEDAAPNPWPRRVGLVVGPLALIGGAYGLYSHETYGKFQQSTDDAFLQADAVTVAPKVGGYVEKLFVVDNQEVKAGDPLVQIDPRDYRAQSAQYEAQIGLAQAQADAAQAQLGEQEAAIAKADADLAAAQRATSFADAQVARYSPLATSGAESGEKLAQLRNEATQAAAKLASARASAQAAHRRIDTIKAQMEQAKAQGSGAKAQLSSAQVNLGSTLLRAAVDGRIGDKSVRLGQFVPAATRLMSVVPVNQLYVTANFKETQLGLMRSGQPVHIKLDALPDVEITGKVDSISPGTGAQFSLLPPQNATGNFTKVVQRVPVRISINASAELRKLLVPGMSVEVSVDTSGAKGALDALQGKDSAR
jgi:membrane fusion protein (multidrug efflux system)